MAGGGQGPTYTSELESTSLAFEEDGSQTGSIRASASGSLLFEGSSSGSTCDVSGLGSISATEFVATSDASLKTDIKRIHDSPLDIVKKLRGCKFQWRDPEARQRYGEQVGVLAQEVEAAGIPEIVSTDPETGRKSVQYDRLCVLLIEAIKQMCGEHDERWEA
jgi:hypothetical protein